MRRLSLITALSLLLAGPVMAQDVERRDAQRGFRAHRGGWRSRRGLGERRPRPRTIAGRAELESGGVQWHPRCRPSHLEQRL
jgi:hypothetical protein